MQPRTLIWIGIGIGSTVGGFIPTLWGAGFLDPISIILSGVGAFAGLWAGYKLSGY